MGAWVGSGTFAARGVPGRFLDPSKPNENAAEEEEVVAAAGGGGPPAAAGAAATAQEGAGGEGQRKGGDGVEMKVEEDGGDGTPRPSLGTGPSPAVAA